MEGYVMGNKRLTLIIVEKKLLLYRDGEDIVVLIPIFKNKDNI